MLGDVYVRYAWRYTCKICLEDMFHKKIKGSVRKLTEPIFMT